jgi:hypothetical protein
VIRHAIRRDNQDEEHRSPGGFVCICLYWWCPWSTVLGRLSSVDCPRHLEAIVLQSRVLCMQPSQKNHPSQEAGSDDVVVLPGRPRPRNCIITSSLQQAIRVQQRRCSRCPVLGGSSAGRNPSARNSPTVHKAVLVCGGSGRRRRRRRRRSGGVSESSHQSIHINHSIIPSIIHPSSIHPSIHPDAY